MDRITDNHSNSPAGQWEPWLVRLPFLLFAVAFVVLNVRLPYRILNSDVAIFGLMGEDIVQHGYLPTYAYGQNYLFSILPYVYAAIHRLAPALSNVMALKLAGCALNLAGLALLFEALLLAQRRNGWGRGCAAAVFCLLLASSSSYLFDLQEHSSIEVSLFVLGWISFFAARLERRLADAQDSRGPDWLLFGLGLGHALYSRPLVMAYGLMMLVWLLPRQWRRTPGWKCCRPLIWFLAGAGLGYLPLLLHNLLRAPTWPYKFHTHTPIGRCDKAYPGLIVFWTMFRILFDLRLAHPLYSALVGVWLLVTAGAALWVLRRTRQEWLGVLDMALPLGSLWIVSIMILIPNFSVNATHRRYGEHLVLAAIWLFARLAPQLPRSRWPALGLAVAVFGVSLASWKQRLNYEVYVNDTLARQLPAAAAELEAFQAPILADFWDAYLLRFVTDGRLPIETYPWQFVRTFNAVPEAELRRRTLWLVREEAIPDVKHWLHYLFRPPGLLDQGKTYALRQPLQFRQFEFWEIGGPLGPEEWQRHETGRQQTLFLWELDPAESVRLMCAFHPKYFSTPSPSGSPGAARQRDG